MNTRYLNFWGFQGARLNSGQSVRGATQKRTWLIKLVSPMLFYSPEPYLKKLREAFVDQVFNTRSWEIFKTQKTGRDLPDYILYVCYGISYFDTLTYDILIGNCASGCEHRISQRSSRRRSE